MTEVTRESLAAALQVAMVDHEHEVGMVRLRSDHLAPWIHGGCAEGILAALSPAPGGDTPYDLLGDGTGTANEADPRKRRMELVDRLRQQIQNWITSDGARAHALANLADLAALPSPAPEPPPQPDLRYIADDLYALAAQLTKRAAQAAPDLDQLRETVQGIYDDARRVGSGICRWCEAPPPDGTHDHDVACPAAKAASALHLSGYDDWASTAREIARLQARESGGEP